MAGSPFPFRWRGKYLNLSRVPTFGLGAWQRTIDALHQDGDNLLILWIGGGFASKRHPVTWAYNADHANIQSDFVGPLIDYSHQQGIRVLLGLTPFGYDGVNQLSSAHPHLRATGPDGGPVRQFGIHCWGWNLCPSQTEAQRLMMDYARELVFDFYPSADGLFLESSDYAVCHCASCRGSYFAREFEFARRISDELWARRPEANIVVYPHYFHHDPVPYEKAIGAGLPFDPRWTLFFTPHSAPLRSDLASRAAGSLYWNEGPAFCDVARIREGPRAARDAGCDGYVPSMECFSFLPTREEDGAGWLAGHRHQPFGFGWLSEGACPYHELPARVARLACRVFADDPDLTMEGFRRQLAHAAFASGSQAQDALDVTAAMALDRSWTQPSPIACPRVARLQDPAKVRQYRGVLVSLGEIARRSSPRDDPASRELRAISHWLLARWRGSGLVP